MHIFIKNEVFGWLQFTRLQLIKWRQCHIPRHNRLRFRDLAPLLTYATHCSRLAYEPLENKFISSRESYSERVNLVEARDTKLRDLRGLSGCRRKEIRWPGKLSV